MNRKDEIRHLLSLSPEEVRRQAGSRLLVCADLNGLHRRMAEDMLSEIEINNRRGQSTRMILPVGPTGQYPILAEMLNRKSVSLERCWFFFMDEYCDDSGCVVPVEHPLSFRGEARRLFLSQLDPTTGLSPERVLFPDEQNIHRLPVIIEAVGGIDTCYGGIGIHGHVAFNEPESGVSEMSARRVQLNDFTVTINAIRAEVGGNLEGFPRYAYTVGMKEILAARHIRLYCRSGCEFNWANTVLRLALFGTPGDDYPVTHIRDKDYTIITDEVTLASPLHIL